MNRTMDYAFLTGILTFWDKLTPQQQELLKGRVYKAKYKAGENVHGGKTDCLGAIIVKEGELRTYMLSEEGREITLFRLLPGNMCILSASCILNSITFDVFIDAEADSELYIINSSVYEQICNENIYAQNFTYKLLTDRFSDVMWAMEQLLFMSFDKRLAIFLTDEAIKQGSDTLSITQDKIAKHIGSAREVVSRMLKYFASEGLVEVSRGGIKILNKQKLRQLINK